ncbi:UN13D protein, partial [Polypterus senegalus]
MANKKGGSKESKTKATSKLRSASPSSRYSLSETDLDQMDESTDSSGPRSATSSPAESEKGSEGAIVSADVDSSPIGEDYLKLERAVKSTASITQLREPGAAGTPASAESAASSTVQEGTIELSELKVLLAELTQDIKKSEKANEKATAKAHERLKQEMKQANEWLQQEIQQANERLRQEVQLELRQVLGKIEERIEKNSVKLSTLTDQLEDFKETFMNRIEMAEHLAASAEEKAVNASSECKKLREKLGDRLAALEDGSRSLVSQEKLRTQGACLVLTVFDYDLLGSDDFEGEAFLSLRDLPGVGSTLDMGNIHQIRLALMHPVPNVLSWKMGGVKGQQEDQKEINLLHLVNYGWPFIPTNTLTPLDGAFPAAWRCLEFQQGIMDIGVFLHSPAGYHGGLKETLQGGSETCICPITRKYVLVTGTEEIMYSRDDKEEF